MTPLEQYKAFLDSAGIRYSETPSKAPEGHRKVEILIDESSDLGEGKVHWAGYMGFVFSFTFDEATGAVIELGAWE